MIKSICFLISCFIFLIGYGQSGTLGKEGDNYHQFSGKVIKRLDIETYDPAGIRIYDTTQYNSSVIPQTINLFHRQTKPKTVKNLLLFEVGDTINSFEIYESERILRKMLFIRDCFIKMQFYEGDTSAVQILVVMQDRFSLAANGTLGNDWRISGIEKNLLGTGHRLAITLGGNKNADPTSLFLSYSAPNIGTKLFQFSADYSTNRFSGLRSFSFSRPLASPLFRWGGGIAYGERNGNGGTTSEEPEFPKIQYRSNRQDAWIGYATDPVYLDKRKISQFVFRGGYSLSKLFRITEQSPTPIVDNSGYSESYILSASFIRLHRFRERYLFSWEQVSDFSEGISVSINQGYINQKDAAHYYSGLDITVAKSTRAGYFALQTQSGIRSQRFKVKEQAVEFNGFYLSPHFAKGNPFSFRTTINGKYTAGGNNPVASPLVTDGRSEDIWQLNGRILQGLTRSSGEIRMILYTPWKPFDFEIAPFLYGGFSTLKSWPQLGINSGVLTAVGPGIILRSTKRAINVIRITFLFYPVMLGQEQPSFKVIPGWLFDLTNPTFDFDQPRPAAGI